mmetsp:Transcript_9074/g.17688  ORF Transcript_9074/g.17688 Transcript_9074/m.17688 type:complete len:337 (+) Transcript_9074:1169-2179(+)
MLGVCSLDADIETGEERRAVALLALNPALPAHFPCEDHRRVQTKSGTTVFLLSAFNLRPWLKQLRALIWRHSNARVSHLDDHLPDLTRLQRQFIDIQDVLPIETKAFGCDRVLFCCCFCCCCFTLALLLLVRSLLCHFFDLWFINLVSLFRLLRVFLDRDCDDNVTLICELDSVGDEVYHNLSEFSGDADDAQGDSCINSHTNAQPLLLGLNCHNFHRRINARPNRKFVRELVGFFLEHQVHDRQNTLSCRVDGVNKLLLIVVQLRASQQAAVTHDTIERVSDVMSVLCMHDPSLFHLSFQDQLGLVYAPSGVVTNETSGMVERTISLVLHVAVNQ